MATYKMVQPGLAQVTRDDGQSIMLPLDEQTAQAQGLTPEAAPGGVPVPSMQNPASMASSPSALASNASPLSGMATDAGGAGVFAQPAAAPDPAVVRQQLLTPQPIAHETRPEPSKFDVTPTEHPAQTVARGLIPVGERAPSAPRPQTQELDPVVLAAMKASGGGGGPAKLGMVSETKKYHESGQVDPALASEIGARQDEADQGASNALEDQAAHKLDYLGQQQTLQQEQARQVQEAMQRRQKVDNEINSLAAKSQAAQDELAQSKPKAVDQFWKDASFGTKLAAGIAIIFGGQVSVRTGGPNQGMEAVNNMVAQWANDERQKYEVAKDKASVTKNAYKDALDTYGSPELAQTNLMLQANAAKEALIKNQAEQVGTPDALATAQLALQESQLERKKLTAQAQAQAGAEVEARFTMQGGGGGGGNGILGALRRGVEAKDLLGKLNGDADPKAAAEARGRQVRLPSGEIAYVSDGSARKEVQSAIDGRTDIISKLEKLAHMQESANLVTDMKARAEYDSLAAAVKSQATVLAGQGAMSAGDEKNITNGIPESGMHIKDAAAALRQTIAGQHSSLESTVRGNVYRDPNATQPYAAPQASSFRPD